ncbi:MAG: AraC family transcriptional regulator [Velocimicrobium sp.]
MREEDLFRVVNQQDEKNEKLVRENLRQVLEDEFILSNVFTRYLDYIEKSPDSKEQDLDIMKIFGKSEALTKKIKDFDISKHKGGMYLHKHTYIELDYVYKGSCTYYINNEKQLFQLKEKELCIVNQNVIHGIKIDHEDDVIFKCMIPFEYIELDSYHEIDQDVLLMKFFRYAMNENLARASYLVFYINDSGYIEELMYHMFCEYLKKNMGWRCAVKNYLSCLFLYLMRVKENEILIVTEIEEENFNIAKVIDCIRKNYQYITLKDIAKDMHFNENYLSRMIKERYGKNFREVLCQIRLQEAEKLLINTDLSVTEIAFRIGYLKPNFFFKLFKDHYGITPIEFRTKQMILQLNN